MKITYTFCAHIFVRNCKIKNINRRHDINVGKILSRISNLFYKWRVLWIGLSAGNRRGWTEEGIVEFRKIKERPTVEYRPASIDPCAHALNRKN